MLVDAIYKGDRLRRLGSSSYASHNLFFREPTRHPLTYQLRYSAGVLVGWLLLGRLVSGPGLPRARDVLATGFRAFPLLLALVAVVIGLALQLAAALGQLVSFDLLAESPSVL